MCGATTPWELEWNEIERNVRGSWNLDQEDYSSSVSLGIITKNDGVFGIFRTTRNDTCTDMELNHIKYCKFYLYWDCFGDVVEVSGSKWGCQESG
jgi:hypothetical protein